MKLKVWLSLALLPMTALTVLAQPATPPSPPPAIDIAPPGPIPTTNTSTNKPVKAHHPKAKKDAKAKTTAEVKPKAKKAKSAEAKKTEAKPAGSMVLNPPVTAVVKCEVLDVRGQGSFSGEVITHLKKGETVTVYEQLTLAKTHTNEPAQWSRIALPTNTPVWVSAEFVDASTKEVKAKKLNVRGGPGENYSVVARIDKGTVVKELRKHQGWMEIETPTNAFAYVASEYLESAPEAPAGLAVATPTPTPAPVPTPAPEPVIVNVPQETPTPAPAPTPVAPPAPAPVGIAAPAPTPQSQLDQELAAVRRANSPQPAVNTPDTSASPDLGKEDPIRVVTREGFVHRCYNIQSPTAFELRDIKTGDLLEYVQPNTVAKKFKGYIGKRVRITGTESLDQRWMRTPILQVESIEPLQ